MQRTRAAEWPHDRLTMARRVGLWLALGAACAMSAANAQTTPRRETPRAERERLLIRIDSLRYEFDHAPLTAEESERLRAQMRQAMTSIEPGHAYSFPGERVTQGYLGVTFDGPSVETPKRYERVIRFLDYPRVSLVEPGSPAERGGVLQGDTLLALNGTDVKDREISLTKLLVPDRRISVRVRRRGRAHDLRVTVDTSPEYMARRMVPMPPMVAMTPMPPAPHASTRPAIAAAPPASVPPVSPVARPVPVMSLMNGGGWEVAGVAGARLETVTEGLGKALGVASGVLVIGTSPGSPAFECGLREGDVILRADSRPVASVRDLRRAVAGADGEEGVRLVVLREKRERSVTLRW
jgi:serine protease Do